MELDFAVLADGVVQRPDGKLDIFGAGIDRIFALALPAQHPTITLALRILLTPQEARSSHRLEFDILDPDGQPRLPTLRGEVRVEQAQLEQHPAGQPLGMATIVNIQGVVFERYGPHALVVLWDGNELTRLRIDVAQPPLPTAEG